jgi:hypothetical protein
MLLALGSFVGKATTYIIHMHIILQISLNCHPAPVIHSSHYQSTIVAASLQSQMRCFHGKMCLTHEEIGCIPAEVRRGQ